MSKAPGWGGGPWALVVELSVVCLWVRFGKSSQIYICIYTLHLWPISTQYLNPLDLWPQFGLRIMVPPSLDLSLQIKRRLTLGKSRTRVCIITYKFRLTTRNTDFRN